MTVISFHGIAELHRRASVVCPLLRTRHRGPVAAMLIPGLLASTDRLIAQLQAVAPDSNVERVEIDALLVELRELRRAFRREPL